MSTADTPDVSDEQLFSDIRSVLEGGSKSRPKARRIFSGLVRAWDLPETRVGPNSDPGANLSLVRQKVLEDDWRDSETWLEREYGTKRPAVAGLARGIANAKDDDPSSAVTRAFDGMEQRATIDSTNPILDTASPIEVDPEIVPTLRSRTPFVQRVTTMAQAGFTAEFNIINARSDPIGMVSETDAVDLSNNTPQDFGLGNDTEEMKIFVDLAEISDFAQRAEATLDYMDLSQTTMGQRIIEGQLFKNRQLYYGDPSVGSSDGSIEDSNAYKGLVKWANDADSSYVIDKSGVSSGFLENIKTELTTVVENTGLTYDAAAIAVSPTMFDALENETNAVVRLDSYDESIQFGGRSIQIKGVEVFEDPNIRNYSGLSSTTTAGGDNGDVFIYDERNFQFRQLAPMSSVPLGKIGLADRAALFEYGTTVSKSQGEHIRVLQAYDV
jgi:hypothetical protein